MCTLYSEDTKSIYLVLLPSTLYCKGYEILFCKDFVRLDFSIVQKIIYLVHCMSVSIIIHLCVSIKWKSYIFPLLQISKFVLGKQFHWNAVISNFRFRQILKYFVRTFYRAQILELGGVISRTFEVWERDTANGENVQYWGPPKQILGK